MKKSTLILLFAMLVCTIAYACTLDKSKMSAYNIRLWYDTPAEELAKAVKDGDTTKINKILNEGKISVDYPDPQNGFTLLTWALELKRDEMVQFLLEKGANPNIRYIYGRSPIHTECRNVDDDTFRLRALLDHGADPNLMESPPPQFWEGINANIRNNLFPITQTATRSLTKTKILLEAGADPNLSIRKCPGRSGLLWAVMLGKKDIVKYLLLEGGADPDKAFLITLDGDTLRFEHYAEDSINYTKEDELQIKEWARQARLRIKNHTPDSVIEDLTP